MEKSTSSLLHWLSSYRSAWVRTTVLLLFAAIFAGCNTSPPSAKDAAAGSEDKLVPGDLISVKILGVTDPPAPYEGPIDENGEFQMLYLNKVKAAGLTPSGLEEHIKDLFLKNGIYPAAALQNMLVTVDVGTRYYYITGEASHGRFPLVGPLTVYRALLAAGGTTEFADLKKVVVHRGTQKIRVDCIKATTDPRYDIQVRSGDIIEVPKKGLLPF